MVGLNFTILLLFYSSVLKKNSFVFLLLTSLRLTDNLKNISLNFTNWLLRKKKTTMYRLVRWLSH